jgi:hypothetical protein
MEIIRDWWKQRRTTLEPIPMPTVPASLLTHIPEAAQ